MFTTRTMIAVVLSLGFFSFAADAQDCNGNGIPDSLDVSSGTSLDCLGDGIPDECGLAGDFDLDGVVDLTDFPLFEACLSGPEALPSGACCNVADYDEDGDVDLVDFAHEQGCMVTRGPVITEILASNDSIYPDDDGDFSDWIEILNPTDAPVNLAGWYLTDDASSLTKWQFPSVVLHPGDTMLVFASDKNRSVAGQPLHTNFKLSAGGEYIGLVRPDGTVVHDVSPEFPEQVTDVSYGLQHSSHCSEWKYFPEPSPDELNTAGFDGFAPEPQFSHEGGLYGATFDLTLSTGLPGGTIRYTLGQDVPTAESALYDGPIQLVYGYTQCVRARVFAPGFVPGPVVSKAFIPAAPEVLSFSSNLPIVVLDTYAYNIDNDWEDWIEYPYRDAYGVYFDVDEGTGRATLAGTPQCQTRAGMKVRGHSSSGFPKKQYKFESWDEVDGDKDVSLLGLPEESDWVIHAPYSDKTLMRNALAYKWSNDMGYYASRTKFVELYLNKNGGPVTSLDYWGIYIVMEQIKRGDDRCAIAKLDAGDDSEPEISGGYIIKHDRASADEETFETAMNASGSFVYVEPKTAEITQAQKNWLRGYLNDFESALYGPNWTDPVLGYEAYIDVDAFIDHHILVEVCKNVDGYRLSSYYHKDRGGKLKPGPAWDYNLTMGNADYSEWNIYTYQNATGWYYEGGILQHAWYDRLLQDPNYVLRQADRWFAWRETVFKDEHVLADMDAFADFLSQEATARNFQKWDILDMWVWPNWYYGSPSNPHTFEMEVDWIRTWMAGNGTPPGTYSDRLAWMDANIGAPAPPVFSRDGGIVEAGYELTMTSANGTSGTIYYTLDGSDPKGDESQVVELVTEEETKRVKIPSTAITNWNQPAFGDSLWTERTGGVGYERDPGSANSFESYIDYDVESAMHGVNSTCYIRIPFEIDPSVAGNVTGLVLRARYDDAYVAYLNGIEVHQSEYSPSTLSWYSNATMYRDDGLAVLLTPSDISQHASLLQAGTNVLAIQALNSSSTSSDFLCSVSLIAQVTAGDVYSYSQTGPVQIDSAVQVKARTHTGSGWSALNEAVFDVTQPDVVINEFMAENDSTIQDPAGFGYPDWLELYNPGIEPVDLGGYTMTDDLSEPTQWEIPAGVTIPAGGWLLIWADNDPEQGDLHATFKLSRGGEEIGLFAPDQSLVDSIVFGEQTADVSQGRMPDGSDNWEFMTSPSPGTSNN